MYKVGAFEVVCCVPVELELPHAKGHSERWVVVCGHEMGIGGENV